MDFIANILAKLDTSQAESQLKTLTKDQTVNLKVKIDGDTDISKSVQKNLSSLNTTASKAGTNVAKSYNAAFQKQISNQSKKVQSFSRLDATTASNKTLAWLKSNTKAAKDYGAILTDLSHKQSLATNPDDLKKYTKQVNAIKAEAKFLGKTGRSFGDEIVRGFKQISQFTYTYGIIQQIPNAIAQSVSELKQMDDILTEISKTSDLTTSQLKELGSTSFDSASKYGKKASDYLTGIQEMSRSGYYGEQAKQMANLSVLAQSAGDIDANMANSYLLASNAAYQYQGNVEKLNALLDGQNAITNRNSVSMQDMAEATTKAASMASELGVAEDQLSAMIGTIESRTKAGGNEVGTALKSLLINVQNTNSDKIVETFEKAGVAQTEFVNGVEQMRNPVEILKDLSKVFNSLSESDPLRTEILTNIGQKFHANKLSALLSGWSDYEKMLVDYSQGAGSAAIEAEKSANNWTGSMNRLSNSWTEMVQGFANTDTIITATNLLNGLVNSADDLFSVFGNYKSVASIFGGGFLTKNGLGILNYDSQKGKDDGFFSGFNSSLINLKRGIPDVSDEVQKLFDKFDLQKDRFGNILKSLELDNIQDNLFKKWVEGLDEVDRASMTAGDALKQYKTHLAEIGETTSLASKAGSAFKSILGNVASFAINAGAIWAVSKALEVAINKWEEYSKAQENAVERGQKALSTMQENQNKIKSAQELLADIKLNTITLSDGSEITRFEQLSQGVNSLGQNVSLTKDEFAEYNSILEQLSGAGFTATDSMSNLDQQLIDLRRSANADTLKGLGDWIDSFNAQNNQIKSDFTKEIGWQQRIDALNKIYADPNVVGDTVEKVDTQKWYERLKSRFEAGSLFQKALGAYDSKTRDVYLSAATEVAKQSNEMASLTESIMDFANQYDIDILDDNGNFDYEKYSSDKVQSQIEDALTNLKSTVESSVRESSGYLKALFENDKNYASISESATTAIKSIFDNIDYDTISTYMMDSNGMLSQSMMQDWVSGISKKITDSGVQDKLNKLFSLNTLKDNIDLSKYKKQANNLITSISNAIPELSPELLKKTSGVEDTIKELETYYNRISNLYGKGNANQLNNRELKLAVDIIANDNFSGTFDELMKRINLAKTEINLEDSTLYDEVEKAFQSENRGDKYKKMVENLKTAKDLYDKGEIGTDDFKAVAKWLSPSGADDAMNFQENWGKAKRYFTEDSAKGVHNFLKDLESKKLAESTKAVDANGNAIEKWSYKISDLEEAAQKLGIGFEPMMEMFGRLEDYGFSNNFVGSLDQGKQRITDKTKELAEAEAHLAELEREGIQKNGKYGNQTAIDAQRDKIAQLRQDIIETTDAMKQLAEHSAKDYEAQVEGAKSAISTLQEEREKVLNDKSMDKSTRESVAGMMEDQIRAWAEEYHIKLDADLNPIDGEKLEEELNIEPITLDIDYSDLDELKSKANDSLAVVQDLVNETSSPMKLNLDNGNLRNVENQISIVSSVLKDLKNEDGIIDISTPGAQEAINVLNALYAQKNQLTGEILMSVDTSKLDGDVAEVIGKLQEFHNAYTELQNLNTLNTAGVKVDTSEAEEKLSSITSELQGLSGKQAEILATIIPDPSSQQSIESSIAAITPKIMVEAGVDETAIEGYNPDDKDAKVKYDVDDSKVKLYDPPNKDGIVKYTADGSQLTLWTPPKKTGTVEYTTSIIQAPSGSSSKKNSSSKKGNKADGTAHVNGTAPRIKSTSFNDGLLGMAHANGDLSLKQDETALTGELGREIVVRNGRFFTIGDNGAEFVNLKKGDIIFNHRQTEDLLSKGYVTGRGKLIGGNAHVEGTAYANGSGGGSLGYGGSGKKSGVNTSSKSKKSTSSKKSTTNNTKAVNKNTAATNKNTEATENLQDWIEYSTNLQSKENDRLYDAIESFEMHANQNKAIDAYITDSQAYMNTLRNAQNAYMSKANALGLDANYIHKIWAGDDISFEDIQDEALRDKISKYQDYYEKAKELGDQMTELNQKIRETKISKLDNIQDDYDNLVSYAEGIIDYNEAVNDLFESRNLVGNQDTLMNNINQQMAIRQALVNEEKELTDQLNALVASGDIAEYTDTWLKWKTEINGVTSAIVKADSALEELKQSIMEIRYKSFEDSLNNLDFNSEMFSSIRDLMSQEGIYDDNVKLTDSGKTQLALMEQELISAKQKVANYNTAIEALAKDLAYGNITQAQFNEKLQEYQKDQMSAVKATKDARDAILDIVKDGITKESEAVQELIQKRKDDLSLQKEYYDFQKKMNDKSKEMNKIRAQIAAMEGDNSLETVAKRKKLMSQLQELEEEYNEELNDRKYDIVQDAYDKTDELTKENEEKSLKELETNLNVQNEAIANALEVTKATYQTVYDQLNILAQQYNFNLTDSLTSPWLNAQSAIDSYQQAIGKVQSNVSIDTSKIQGTTPSQNQTVPTKNEASTQNLDKSANGTWLKQGNQWWYQHNDGGWTNDGWESIDGQWYKFDREGWMQTGWQPWGTDSTGNAAWYYLTDSGAMARSTWIAGANGAQYYVDSTGVMARNGYVKSVNSGMYYWVNGDGVWEPQWNTYNPNLNKYKLYYNSGKKRVPYDALAYIDDTPDHKLDLGSEAIITDKGALVQMDAGDTVFNKAQKEFLYEFSKGQIPAGARSMLPSVNTNFASMKPVNKGDININYGSLLTVNGDIDKEVFPGMQKTCESTFDYFVKNMRKYKNRLN